MRALLASALAFCSVAANAASLDLSSWSTQNYATLTGHANGQWTLVTGGVRHNTNAQPSLFLAPGTSGPLQISGQVRTTDSDDDFFGFAFGVGAGDWLLIDWKKASQTHNFTGGTANATPGSTARVGLAASLVQGTPTGDEFWGHTNFVQDAGGGLTELARATTLGQSGYVRNAWYDVDFLLLNDRLTMSVNGVEQFSIAGEFADGRWGFYNFSQPATEYRAFTATSVVPEPATLLLSGSGLMLLSAMRRRKA